MRTKITAGLVLAGVAAGLLLGREERASAQTFSTLYNFQATTTNRFGFWTNQLGATPSGALLLLGQTLYGTTGHGGSNGTGCIYTLNTNGTGFATLHTFPPLATNQFGFATNRDGASPAGGLIAAGTNLYGVALYGGANGQGAIFSLNTNGAAFTVLHAFAAGATNSASGLVTNNEGGTPACGLILSGSTLYGTTQTAGTNGNGTVFAVQTNGSGFRDLHAFSALVSSNNADGANPYAPLFLAGGTLYGTAEFGGTNGNGTVFSVGTNGAGFSDLHSFARVADWASGPYANIFTNGDGANPRAQIISAGNLLYGTATFGGLYGYGTVFALATNGTGFTSLHYFAAGNLDLSTFGITNHDGTWPQPGVVWSGDSLYGVCEYGGLGLGTVFSLDTNGAAFTVLHDFPAGSTVTIFPNSPNNGGAYPQTQFTLSGGVLYSSSAYGGTFGSGTLFTVSGIGGAALPAPPLAVTKSGTNVVIAWPTNFTGYTLQSTTNLAPAAWKNVTPVPVVINGEYVVTNGRAPSPAHVFYRLLQ
jgi:uncharacterized repeat protein (TIGR03803 family)